MVPDVHEPVTITLKMHGITYQTSGLPWDSTGEELKKAFSCLMVSAGFSPSNIETEDGGRWEYLDESEEVVRREEL